MIDPLGRSLAKTVEKKKGPQNGHRSLRSEVEGKRNSKKGVKLRSKKISVHQIERMEGEEFTYI